MSTPYVFNDEMSALASGAAENDVMLIHDTSAGTKKTITPAVLRGAVLGTTSASTLGFFGKTETSRYTTSVAVPASTNAVSVSATQWGFSTSTQANALISAVARMADAMQLYGLTISA